MTATSSPRSREETPPPPPALLAPVISQDVNPDARLVVMCCLPIISLESAAAAAAGVAAAAAALVRNILSGPLSSIPRPQNESTDGIVASRTYTTTHTHGDLIAAFGVRRLEPPSHDDGQFQRSLETVSSLISNCVRFLWGFFFERRAQVGILLPRPPALFSSVSGKEHLFVADSV